MTQKGLAGKAVGAAVLCSAIGGVASALVMMSATEPLAKWAITVSYTHLTLPTKRIV